MDDLMAAATCRAWTLRAAGSPGSIVPIPAEAATWDVAPLGGSGRGMARRRVAAGMPRRPAGLQGPKKEDGRLKARPRVGQRSLQARVSVSAQGRLLRPHLVWANKDQNVLKVSKAPGRGRGWKGWRPPAVGVLLPKRETVESQAESTQWETPATLWGDSLAL